MVAGGFNIKDSALASVEYLDLGTDLKRIPVSDLKWRSLPRLRTARPEAPVLVNTK